MQIILRKVRSPQQLLCTGKKRERCEMDEEQHRFSWLRRGIVSQYAEFAAAVQFLSVLPVPGSRQLFEKDGLAPRLFPGARPTGLGAAFHRAVTTKRLLLAAIVTLAIVLLAGQLSGLIVWMAVTTIALILGSAIARSIGGLTGDSYGAIEEVAEVVALLVLIMLRG